MGDEQNQANLQTDQAGQPGQASQDGAPVEGTAQPVTLEQVQALLQEFGKTIEQKVLDQAVRRSQSLVDKADRRITERLRQEFQSLDKTVELLKGLGVEIDPAMVERAKQVKLIQEFQGQEQLPGEDSRPQESQPTEPDFGGSPAVAAAWQMQQEAGVFIEDNDPEVAMLKLDGTVTEMLTSLSKAIEAKKARLAGTTGEKPGAADDKNQQQTQTEGDDVAKLAARNPGGVGTGRTAEGPPDGLSSMDYFRRAYSK